LALDSAGTVWWVWDGRVGLLAVPTGGRVISMACGEKHVAMATEDGTLLVAGDPVGAPALPQDPAHLLLTPVDLAGERAVQVLARSAWL
jgi:alpha-tubulin suppressor-like RCC1 family protein